MQSAIDHAEQESGTGNLAGNRAIVEERLPTVGAKIVLLICYVGCEGIEWYQPHVECRCEHHVAGLRSGWSSDWRPAEMICAI